MTDQVSQHSVTLDTLALLQETLDYLNRLPVVPVTHALCRKIAAHLEEPTVASAKRLALENERLANTRVARMYSPAGTLLAEVIVTADTEPCPTRCEPERRVYFHPGMSPKRGR